VTPGLLLDSKATTINRKIQALKKLFGGARQLPTLPACSKFTPQRSRGYSLDQVRGRPAAPNSMQSFTPDNCKVTTSVEIILYLCLIKDIITSIL
jgi:hypothetical protein